MRFNSSPGDWYPSYFSQKTFKSTIEVGAAAEVHYKWISLAQQHFFLVMNGHYVFRRWVGQRMKGWLVLQVINIIILSSSPSSSFFTGPKSCRFRCCSTWVYWIHWILYLWAGYLFCGSKITSHLEFYVSYLAFYVMITVFMYRIGSIGTASFYGANVRPLRRLRVRPG